MPEARYAVFMIDLKNTISIIQHSKCTLFILCGFPYVGKSHIAKQLLQKIDIALVSIDDIFNRSGFDWDSSTLPDAKAWELIFNESYEQTKQTLREGKNVLYDSTNQTIVSRDTLREIAKGAGADVCVLYIKTPIETVWRRWEENQSKPSRSVVSRELVQMTIDMFEEPGEDESVIVIHNS